jgi:hypothetical protein
MKPIAKISERMQEPPTRTAVPVAQNARRGPDIVPAAAGIMILPALTHRKKNTLQRASISRRATDQSTRSPSASTTTASTRTPSTRFAHPSVISLRTVKLTMIPIEKRRLVHFNPVRDIKPISYEVESFHPWTDYRIGPKNVQGDGIVFTQDFGNSDARGDHKAGPISVRRVRELPHSISANRIGGSDLAPASPPRADDRLVCVTSAGRANRAQVSEWSRGTFQNGDDEDKTGIA